MQKSFTRAYAAIVAATQLPALLAYASLPQAAWLAPLALAAAVLVLVPLTHPPVGLKPFLSTSLPTALLVIVLAFVSVPAPVALPYTAIALLFCAAALRLTGHPWLQTNQVLLAVAACPLLFTLTAQGSIFPAWGLIALATTLLIARQRVGWAEGTALLILTTWLSLLYPALVLLPLVLTLGLAAVWPRRAAVIGVLGTLAALLVALPYPLLFSWAHLNALLPGPEFYPAVAFLILTLALMVYNWRWWPPALQAAWALGAPLYIASAALAGTSTTLAATLLTLPLPLVAYTILKPNFRY